MESRKELQSLGGGSKLQDYVDSIRARGVTLWSEKGCVHFKGPKGILTEDERQHLRACKSSILALLEADSDSKRNEAAHISWAPIEHAPLSFSQVAHWNSYRLRERPAIRHLASATRLRGPLNVDALRESLAVVVRRHAALRTRIVQMDGMLVQEVISALEVALPIVDLTSFERSVHEFEMTHAIEQLVMEPIDVAKGPLFGVQLLKMQAREHVLIVAMEHLVSDAVSMGIALRDLFTVYAHIIGNEFLPCLPQISVQFPAYASEQKRLHESWLMRHGHELDAYLASARRVRFSRDAMASVGTQAGWATVPLVLGMELKMKLQVWSRLHRTTLVMAVFTAYVAVVMRWCGVSDAVVIHESDGRTAPCIQHTVGYLASALYVRIQLHEGATFIDLLAQV